MEVRVIMAGAGAGAGSALAIVVLVAAVQRIHLVAGERRREDMFNADNTGLVSLFRLLGPACSALAATPST
jgi:hypothetical protein